MICREFNRCIRQLDRLSIRRFVGNARWKDGHIEVHLRQADGSFSIGPRSACFPWLPMEELTSWLDRGTTQDETSWVRAFRVWVRESLRLS